MRLRKILAGFLAFTLLVTALPVGMISRAEGSGSGQTSTTVNTSNAAEYLFLNRYQVNSGNIGQLSGCRGDIIWDHPSLYETPTGIYTTVSSGTFANTDRWPYIAVKVNVEETRGYDISTVVKTSGSKYSTFGMIVDGVMHVLKFTDGQETTVTENVKLSKGEHIIVFTSPMPEDPAAETTNVSNNPAYPWFDFYSFTFSEGMTVTKPTREEVHASVKGATRLEAENTKYVNRHIYNEGQTEANASGGIVVGGMAYAQCQQTFADLQANGLVKEKMPYLQYAVEAPKEGYYYITIGAGVGSSNANNKKQKEPYLAVLVNGKNPVKAQFDGGWGKLDSVTVPVYLEEGVNIITCTSMVKDDERYEINSSGWVNIDYFQLQKGLTAKPVVVNGTDSNYMNYLFLNGYALSGSYFGQADTNNNNIKATIGDLRWDYPSLYGPQLGIYSNLEATVKRAGKWPYIAFKVHAEKAGEYTISTKVNMKPENTVLHQTFGMIVDGATYVLEVEEGKESSATLSRNVYLTAGEHIVIFTVPMPRDAKTASNYSDGDTGNNTRYTWFNYHEFSVSEGLIFSGKPDSTDIQTAMTNYARIESEDGSYASYNKNYNGTASITYTTRYNTGNTTIVGAQGLSIDGTVSAEEKKANTTQTFDDIKNGNLNKELTSYIQHTVLAEKAGTYVIRIGAYVEGSGTMPYGTILVNGTAYKAQFSGNWNGYDAANLTVELQAGENIIQCIGVTADQTGTNGWIGYDFIDVPTGITTQRQEISASDGDWDAYLHLNEYTDKGANFGGPNYDHMRYDYLSLYEDMLGIYSDKMPDRANKWPYIAFTVSAEQAGEYQISAKIEKSVGKTLGMIVDGAVYVINVTSNEVTKSVYLTEGEHVIIFTPQMPRDMESVPKQDDSLYPWINYCSFKLSAGLSFVENTTNEDIQDAMTEYTRIEAEDISFASTNGNYNSKISKTYTRRYGKYVVKIKGIKGAKIDGSVSDSEKKVNTTQTYEDISNGLMDAKLTSYVQYNVLTDEAGIYMIRVGAYVEGSGTMPYGTILVNGKAYKAQFSGNWNGYDAANLTVELQAGENIIQCIGVTADQTETNGWIGYDFIDVSRGIGTEHKEVSASDKNWKEYLKLNLYLDNGTLFGVGNGSDGYSNYGHIRYDYPSLYEDMLGIYSDVKPDRANWWPYVAFTVNAEKAGEYQISAKIGTNENADTVGMIVDGAMYIVKVSEASELLEKVYLSKGEHVIVFTSPMPRDMESAPTTNGTNKEYPYIDYYAFKLGIGLSFGEAPTDKDIQKAMTSYTRLEAEDIVYATYNGNYSTDVTKKYSSRYNNALTTIIGAKGAAIDGKVTAEELKANNSQSYVQYSIKAKEAGVYMIRVGAYVEGNGTMPYGTILVNGTAYKVQFTGNWNGYDVVNLPVELQKGTNTIQCIGVTADQTGSNAWIGYDYLDIQSGLSANKTGATVINAGDEKHVTINKYKDQGDVLGDASYDDLRWDRLSLDMLNYAYLGRMPYAAVQVKATVDGTYDVYFTSQYNTSATSTQMGVLVDGVTTYTMALSEFRSHVSIPLTAGTHTLVFTTPMPENLEGAAITAKFDNKAYPWMNMEKIILGKGLTVEKAPDKNKLEKPYQKIEVEEYAIPNLTRITENGAGGGQYLKAQTAAEIVKNGIKTTATPYVEYHIDASAAGEYTIYVAMTSGMSAAMTAEKQLCNIVIENGDARQVKQLYTHKDTSNVAKIIPVTLTLQKGINEVRITHFTGDSIQDKGYVWNDFDYIEMSPETAKKITFLSTSVLEAEEATYSSYIERADEGMSGEAYLGDADYGYIDQNKITFEALDVENLDDVPRVTYTFEAEKAGTYTLSVKFRTGLINYKPEELEKIGFAVIVNGKGKQLVEYEMATMTASITRSITVDLVEGENEITFTSTLYDFMNAVSPRIESEYRLVYVDHDALYISDGLSTGKEAEKFSIEDSSVEHSQLKLLGIAGDDVDDVSGVTAKQVVGIVLSISLTAIIVTIIILTIKNKKQKDGGKG